MSRADSGGFDMVLEVSFPAINEMAHDLLPTDVDQSWSIDINLWNLLQWGMQAKLHVVVGDVQVAAGVAGGPPTASWSVSAVGTQMCWDSLDIPVFADIEGGCHPFEPVVTLSATLMAAGRRLSIEQITATVMLPPGTLESVPGVTTYLTLFDLFPGGRTTEQARSDLYQTVQSGLTAALNAVLIDTVSLATLPVDSVALAVIGSELRVMMNVDAVAIPPSSPAAITRSALHQPAGSASGTTALAALVVGNDWLFRNMVRPVLGSGLGLQANGFAAQHPCFWIGSKHLASQFDMDVAMTQVMGEIDQGGHARVTLALRGKHSTDAFGLTARATIGLGVSITEDTLHVEVQEPTVHDVDVWVAGWVYALAFLVPAHPLVLLALGLVDACAGDGAEAALAAALKGKVKVPDVDIAVPSVGGLHVELTMAQVDAEWQMAILPIAPLTVTLPVSRANDVIGRLNRAP